MLLIDPPGLTPYAVFRPESVSYAANVNSIIDHLVWSVWDSTHAVAQGQHVVDDCIPNCAQGKISRQPVTITLTQPQAGLFTTFAETRGGHTTTMSGRYILQGSLPASARRPLPTGATGTQATTSTTPSASTQHTTARPSATASAGCPSPAVLLATWRSAYPGTAVTRFTNISCWRNWVVGFAIGEGNGSVKFLANPVLHVTTEAEGVQFRREVCAAAGSPTSWKSNPSIMRC